MSLYLLLSGLPGLPGPPGGAGPSPANRRLVAPPGAQSILQQSAPFHGADGYPTLPSRLTLSSFWASTANSIGSSRKTSLQNPLTMRLTASSVDSPRWRQ